MSVISPEWLEALSVLTATGLAGVALRGQWGDATARRKSADAMIGAEAYVVRRTLRSWILAAEHLRAMQGTPPRLALAEQDKTVEDRLQRAITAAPHASRPIAAAIREAYVLYFRATAKPHVENLADLQAKPRATLDAEYAAALADMRACVTRLTDAIVPELREK
ncbi:MAG: hypothetical protein E6J91_26895 [Deltaproteobacteria bacterium]|nr:MAG: hypothetical protein E6J91_26895 [Deltaproteobacteria bacterium]HXG96342.1 hypothetical protein [Gemmatimonadales bacterium]